MSDAPAILTAKTSAEILAAVAMACWQKDHDGADCPHDMIPTETDVIEWLPDCPPNAQVEAVRLTSATGLTGSGGPNATSHIASDEWQWMAWRGRAEQDRRATLRTAIADTSDDPDRTLAMLKPQSVLDPPHPPCATFVVCGKGEALARPLETVHRHWAELEGKRPLHPLAPLVRAWQQRPVTVTPETRRDRRILPVVRAGKVPPERKRGMLFGGLVDNRAQTELPLFDAAPVRKSVAILDLADASGVPVMAQGRGAPLPARLFVRAGMSVAPDDRKHDSVRMALTVREFRDGLFPNGWRIGKDWLKLKAALVHARDYTIRLPDGGRWFMLALRRLPFELGGKPSLDDYVVLDIAFPPCASNGPVIDLQVIDQLSVESAPRWRAYIAAHALAWQPGVIPTVLIIDLKSPNLSFRWT